MNLLVYKSKEDFNKYIKFLEEDIGVTILDKETQCIEIVFEIG